MKGQAFYSFVSTYYGHYGRLTGAQKVHIEAQKGQANSPVIRPHYLLEPTFLGLAGVAASLVQAFIQFPISRIQELHYGRLAWIDSHPRAAREAGMSRSGTLGLYASAYRKTLKEVFAVARRDHGLRRWAYRGFLMNTLTQVPSTAAGLIVFEVIRRKYGTDQETVRINKDGYDILLV